MAGPERMNVGARFYRGSKAFDRYLRGDRSVFDGKEGYEHWRQTVPWTNEQIAAALDLAAVDYDGWHQPLRAASVRSWATSLRGGFGLKVDWLREALPVLIKQCSLCHRRALYRRANEGRCRKHMHLPSKAQIERDKRRALRCAAEEQKRKEQDDRDLQNRSLRKTAKAR